MHYICFRDPTPIYDDQLKVKWKSVEPNVTNFLKIDVDLQMINENLDGDRMAFWDNLYNLVLASDTYEILNASVLSFSIMVSGTVVFCGYILVRYKQQQNLPERRHLI